MENNNDFDKLFNLQVQIFKNRGVPEQILEFLSKQKNEVMQITSEQHCDKGNIPFLPVITPAYLGYYGLVAMMQNGLKEGYNLLKSGAIMNLMETFNDIYYIYNIENGEATRGRSPRVAEKIFKEQSRLPLNGIEIINLCILTSELSKRYVWAVGSRYESVDKVVDVFLDGEKRPILYWHNIDYSNDHWGAPSCSYKQ